MTPELEAKLLDAAWKVRELSYSPYSKFSVGAALLTFEGEIVLGTNVENASYGNTICAEQSAVVSAVSKGLRSFEAIAVVAESPEPTPPCGICRQFLAEFSPDMVVVYANAHAIQRMPLRTLIPELFTKELLPDRSDPDAK